MRPIPVAFHVGPLEVHTYGIGLAVTFWFAYRYVERRLRAAGYPTEWLVGTFVWVIVAAVVGARAMHVAANLSYYAANPGNVVAIWHGGLSSFGGLLLAVPTGILLARRRCPELTLGRGLDLAVPALAAAWALGRLLGPQLMVAGGGHPTQQWFGMYYATQIGKRLPVPIFQAMEDAALFLVLLYVERRCQRRAARTVQANPARTSGTTWPLAYPTGAVTGTALVLWGVARTLDQHLWLAYPGQLGSTLVQLAGIGFVVGGLAVLALSWGRWRTWPARPAPRTAASEGPAPTPPARTDVPAGADPADSPAPASELPAGT